MQLDSKTITCSALSQNPTHNQRTLGLEKMTQYMDGQQDTDLKLILQVWKYLGNLQGKVNTPQRN